MPRTIQKQISAFTKQINLNTISFPLCHIHQNPNKSYSPAQSGTTNLDSSVRQTGGCFTNVSQAHQNDIAKIHNASNHIYDENFKLKLCPCAQSMALGIRTKFQLALGTRTKFQLVMLIGSAIFAIHKFRDNILESWRNVSETNPRLTSI